MDPEYFLEERGQVGGSQLFHLVISSSGYSKDNLMQLLTDYRNFNPDQSVVELDAIDSPVRVRERSPSFPTAEA